MRQNGRVCSIRYYRINCIQNYSYVIEGYIFYSYYDASYYAWHIEGTEKEVITNSCYFDVEYDETEEFEDSDRYEKEFHEARRKAYEEQKKEVSFKERRAAVFEKYVRGLFAIPKISSV